MWRYNIYGKSREIVKVSGYVYETEAAALDAAKRYELEELLRHANRMVVRETKKHQANKRRVEVNF
jgi:hypothetical protein